MGDNRFSEPPRYTFLQSMGSLFNTAKATILAGPQGLASEELYQERLAVCQRCDRREAIGPIWKCGICNCLLHLKAAAAPSVCPDYQWKDSEKWMPKGFVKRSHLS
jgi:hypothetical protein